jgi:ribosomal protein S18 acetylase RimI-like enzyme
MKIKIENLKIHDLDEFFTLFKELIETDFPYPPAVRKIDLTKNFNKEVFKRRITAKGAPVFLAKLKDQIVGFVVPSDDWGGVVRIQWLGVKKEFRKMGIASELLQEVERWALDNHFHCIYLYTETKDNIEFYKKHGFEYIGLQKEVWYGVNEHLLQKNIHEPFPEIFKI